MASPVSYCVFKKYRLVQSIPKENKMIFFIFQLIIFATVCIRNCTGRNDGDYQSCFTCTGFITCSNSEVNNKTCAGSFPGLPLHWDNIQGKCLYSSSTCDPAYLNETLKKIWQHQKHVICDRELNLTWYEFSNLIIFYYLC